jgi:hypothetical protein
MPAPMVPDHFHCPVVMTARSSVFAGSSPFFFGVR